MWLQGWQTAGNIGRTGWKAIHLSGQNNFFARNKFVKIELGNKKCYQFCAAAAVGWARPAEIVRRNCFSIYFHYRTDRWAITSEQRIFLYFTSFICLNCRISRFYPNYWKNSSALSNFLANLFRNSWSLQIICCFLFHWNNNFFTELTPSPHHLSSSSLLPETIYTQSSLALTR